jgi:light-regulated signal transduction histidine kinase (bacteriophytochrome)
MPEPTLKANPEIEKLKAELEVAESRLRRANADFQEFVSRVSHDLREPLRTISSYCQLLKVKNTGHSDEDTELYLRYMIDGAERAQSLLAAMVEYATAEPEKRHPTRVDMNTVFFEAARAIRVPEGAITHDPLPAVIGDFDPLTKVMQHLLDNAVKFAGRPDPKVHVSARPDGYDWIISVCDNGPGIDPAHFERIFGLFRRLHGRDIPGNGLGLAFARKAIESLGGRIWVESKPGSGSTFSFSLPGAD